jgi:hypothetical protein
MEQGESMSNPIVGADYKHFKGGIYRVVALGHLADDASPVVIYRNTNTNETWVRKLLEWGEEVDRPEYNYKGPRFARFGQTDE